VSEMITIADYLGHIRLVQWDEVHDWGVQGWGQTIKVDGNGVETKSEPYKLAQLRWD